MSVRLFSIIGDANVRRNMTGLNVASREVMKSAQIIDYLGVTPIEQALSEVRDESSVCIVTAITDLLLSGVIAAPSSLRSIHSSTRSSQQCPFSVRLAQLSRYFCSFFLDHVYFAL